MLRHSVVTGSDRAFSGPADLGISQPGDRLERRSERLVGCRGDVVLQEREEELDADEDAAARRSSPGRSSLPGPATRRRSRSRCRR